MPRAVCIKVNLSLRLFVCCPVSLCPPPLDCIDTSPRAETSWGVDGTRCFKWVGAQSAVWACKWAIGDVIGLAANVDVGKIATSKNGNWSDEACGVVFSDDRIKEGVFPCLSSSNYSVRYAFEDFQYAAPAPEAWSDKAESV